MLNVVVVDIECFIYRTSDWIIKEIAIQGEYTDSIVLKPPCKFELLEKKIQTQFRWITKHLHGISWECGDHPYSFLPEFVKSVTLRYPDACFYTKGSEKALFLRDLFGVYFYNLDDIKCPKFQELSYLYQTCSSDCHSNTWHCARKKAVTYYSWLRENGLHEC